MVRVRKGSITLLASLTIMMISAAVLSLLEAARLTEFEKVTQICTDTAAESLFANYQSTIWDQYGLLMLEAGESENGYFSKREGYLKDLIDEELYSSGKNKGSYFQAKVQNVEISQYNYITDQNGELFEMVVSASLGNKISSDTYDYLNNLGEEFAIYEADSAQVEEKRASVREYNYDENPANSVKEVDADGILALVLPRGTRVSGVKLSENQKLEGREIAQGTGAKRNHQGYETLITEGYLLSQFSNYAKQKDEHGLRYELEYVIAGCDSEIDNLKAIVHRILLIREASNFAYLLTDAQKVAEAEAIAITLASLALNPALVEPIKYGLLAAWAYVESILDVRALMNGKKVDLFKNSASWTSGLSNLSQFLDGSFEAKESETGISYEMYLGGLLFLTGTKARSYRALTAIEETVRQTEQRSFYINDAIVSANVEVSYQYHSAFAGMEEFTKKYNGVYGLEASSYYSYLAKT